jgi:ankyrin repeat protein
MPIQVVKTADLELLGWLLDQEGANIEARDSSGNTLLHWAAVSAVSAL